MGRKERVELIRKIEEKRGSGVITYILSDRMNIPPAMIADDAIEPMYNQLEILGFRDKIDLVLYTRGGFVISSFRIAKLIRNYCRIFTVLVPFRAHSGGTQICLAADKIIMSSLSELSPVDPSTANPFNPTDKFGRPIPISVEDVIAYFNLAEKIGGLVSESSKVEVFRILTNQAPALALGNVGRVYNEIRHLVTQLLSLHMDEVKDKSKIEKIMKALTEEYTHEYYITVDEAERIGLPVERPDKELENLMMKLYKDYAEELHLAEPFDPDAILGNKASLTTHVKYGFIETAMKSYVNVGEVVLSRPTAAPQQIQLPAMPTPITIVPHPSALPVSVRFKSSKWIDISEVPECV
jgi:hypothetical protein